MRRSRFLRRWGGPLLAVLCGALALFVGRYAALTPKSSDPSPKIAFPPQALVVTVVSVGQGEASWVKTPENKFLVIGTGPVGSGPKLIASLKAAGATQIDLLVLPYPYSEVVGGVSELVAAFPIKAVLDSGGDRVNKVQSEALDALIQKRIPIEIAQASRQAYDLGGGRLDVLFPGKLRVTSTPVAANNSVVLHLVWGETTFLWEGGLEADGERALLSQGVDLTSDWLRVGRFGNAGASSSEFLRAVSPEFAVISVGPNSNNLPGTDTLTRLSAAGIELFRTDQSPKDLVFLSDGQKVWVRR
jgi:competence protein ComEC